MSRPATHAGSWYTSSKTQLDTELTSWLSHVTPPLSSTSSNSLPIPNARIIIAPHAGYSYSGPAAAYAYKSLDLSNIKRVFILGPSHHAYLDGCAVTTYNMYDTPLGRLKIDRTTTEELYTTGKFTRMTERVDDDEHSIEMHLPYTYKMISLASSSSPKNTEMKTQTTAKMDEDNFPLIVPILVGSISAAKEKIYGTILKPYLTNPENAFIISSDFCHWGLRFSYTRYQPSSSISTNVQELHRSSRLPDDGQPIHKSIEDLDKRGIQAIETGSHKAFVEYLKETKNTICGRHPIGVVMAGLEEARGEMQADGDEKENWGRFKFVRYEQSSQCEVVRDSSVSYASAFAIV